MSFTNRDNPIKNDCTFNGIPLFGDVEVVKGCADFTVQIVTSLPDIDVDTNCGVPTHCGEWNMVKGCSDFTIQYVNGCADIKVRFVKGLPGLK
jgi:hypothetical protein